MGATISTSGRTTAALAGGPVTTSGPCTTTALAGGPLATSGPCTTAALASGPLATSGSSTAAVVARGTAAAGTAMATRMGTASASTLGLGVAVSALIHVAGVVAAGYLGYRGAKALWEWAARSEGKGKNLADAEKVKAKA